MKFQMEWSLYISSISIILFDQFPYLDILRMNIQLFLTSLAAYFKLHPSQTIHTCPWGITKRDMLRHFNSCSRWDCLGYFPMLSFHCPLCYHYLSVLMTHLICPDWLIYQIESMSSFNFATIYAKFTAILKFE